MALPARAAAVALADLLSKISIPGSSDIVKTEVQKVSSSFNIPAPSTGEEKPEGEQSWINGGFFVINPNFFKYLKDDKTVLESDPLEKITDLKEIKAFKHEGSVSYTHLTLPTNREV